MHYHPATAGYSHCRGGGSDAGPHRRHGRRDPEPFDSGDSNLSELDESESGSGSGIEVDPNLPYPGIAPIALKYLTQTTRPRNWCLTLISNPWFERVSMLVILLNCITLGMYQPCTDDACETSRCRILQIFDDFIFAFFTIEMLIKMVAMGVHGKGTYLADNWNRLDMFIVIAAAIEYGVEDNLNLSAMRTIRVLRPLRAINRIPSMRILVMLLLDTLPMLGNVLLLCFFVFFIFGIVGVQLWHGILRQRCTFSYNTTSIYNLNFSEVPRYYSLQPDTEYICSQPEQFGMHSCGGFASFTNGSNKCNLTIDEKRYIPEYANNDSYCINWNFYYNTCNESFSNPFQGTISFDNIGLAWVSIFLVISLEGWTDIMYFVQDAHSFWDWIYFVLLIVIGSFFMINLCLVVIATQFSETKKREMERMRLERARFQSSSTLASSTNFSEPATCYAEIVKYIAHLWRRSKRRLIKRLRLYRVEREHARRERKMISGETIRLNYAKKHHPNCPKVNHHYRNVSATSTRPVSRTTSPHEEVELGAVGKQQRPSLLRVPSISNQEISSNNNDSLLSPPSAPNNRRRSSVMFSDVVVLHDAAGGAETTSSPSSSANIDRKNICQSEKTTQTGDGNIWQISSVQQGSELLNGEAMTCQELLALGAINAALPTGQIVLDSFFSSLTKGTASEVVPDEDFSCCHDLWHCDAEYNNETRSRLYISVCMVIKGCIQGVKYVRKGIKRLVDHKSFQQGILLAILINTFSMGIEYHGQSESYEHAVETSNIIFSVIFAVEMLLKVIGEGPFGYISNGFNVFDGIIVILSGVELTQQFFEQSHTDSGLSVLRTFRLLRILKLVRFMPNLRRQLFVMLRTMDNVAVFFSLLILFIFIFSILGMYLFGGKFCNYRAEDGTIKECTCEMIVTNDKRCECDRKHFNNILWATVTVFQILTQEDWNMVLSNGMAKTSHWAALYFVALMTFGNYVLFNLLVAILVEGFSSERNERREREQREMARRKMSCMLEQSSLRGSSEETSRSYSSSSGSYPDAKNCWRSAEDLRKPSNNGHKHRSLKYLCKDKLVEKDCSYLQTPIGPKCNIQKESMLKQPARVSPPIITHTAATPQDSPNTTLDDFLEFKYNVTSAHEASISESPEKVSTTESTTQKTSTLSLLKPPSMSPPPLTFRQFEQRPIDPIETITIEKNEKNNKQKMQRKCSWKLSHRPSLRKKKNRSESDAEAVPLNNGRDHSQCNGGGISRQASLRNDSLLQSTMRIQNDTQKDAPNNRSAKGLSPQMRGRSNTYSAVSQHKHHKHHHHQVSPSGPTLTRHNSLVSQPSAKINKSASPSLSRKSINSLNDKQPEGNLPKIKMDDCIQMEHVITSPVRVTGIKRILQFTEPTGCMKGREDYSLYLFASDNWFRQMCHSFVNKKWFDNLVLLFIAMNCITLAMERPNIPANSAERSFLHTCNYIFTFVFSLEMFVKVVASGMCYGPNAYFTSGWNIMDGSLVLISIIDLLMSLISVSSPKIFNILRVFRLLRSLRPLRVINRAPGLKLVVQTLLSSLRPIGNIVLICCTFFIIFGILGVQLFKGSFHYCIGENLTGILTDDDCTARGYKWENQKYNFDHLGQALMSLFVLSSRDGWVNIMYDGLDAVGVGRQPITNYSEWRLLYFISFILLVGFFVLNMFVGVVVENFHRCREEQEKEERIRRAAKRALQMEKRRRKMNEPPYYINYAPWRLFIHSVVTSKYFDLAIAAVIGLNVITMATECHEMLPIHDYVLKIFNYFFTAVFILESTMKIIALGFVLYVKDRWNILDVGIVILSVVGIVLEELGSNIIPINPTVLRVMRVMRIARVLKLLKMAKGIRALLDTVMQALPQVGNLGLLFFLLFFIFAALGVELFGRLNCKKINCQGLGEHAHFENFGMAFLTLFRVATGDNWNGIMKDTLSDEKCDKSAKCVTNCCVSKIIAPIFFVIFVLMAQFVLVNVVVAVLMKHLEESHKHLEDEQDMDHQLEREFAEKQEMEEKRELCLALQMDQEYHQRNNQCKPLIKVLSLPANFTYHPPGTRAKEKRAPLTRRQTLHSHQPIQMLNLDDIRNIDESSTDIYSIRNVEEVITLNEAAVRTPLKRVNETSLNDGNLLVPILEAKPRLYGSTKHLFCKQASMEVGEETPFLQVEGLPKHDSQESVQRIIRERRKLDESLKEMEYDIFDVTTSSEENLVEKE